MYRTSISRLVRPVLSVAVGVAAMSSGAFARGEFTRSFRIEECEFSSTGRNPYFVLEVGNQSVFRGREDGERVDLTITVLNETEIVDGVVTRVVEERELHDGELAEVSRNFFAICAPTNTVFYFGEDVDNYRGGQVANHHGSWRAGVNEARPGVMMPGLNLLGAKYFQELAPRVAMDQAETVSLTISLDTPAGSFDNCLRTRETTPLEPDAVEFKVYAPGIGLVRDGSLLLVSTTEP